VPATALLARMALPAAALVALLELPSPVRAALVAAPAAGAPGYSYYRLTYDHEVAAQCGLASAAVREAYLAAREREGARTGLDVDALKSLRIRAIVDAEHEYQNRGLGGYRAWCAGEARDGVERLLDAD